MTDASAGNFALTVQSDAEREFYIWSFKLL